MSGFSSAVPTAEPVPVGTIADVLAWVGDDPTRAQEAYDAELASSSPRSTLLTQLEAEGAS